jgi:DNA-binding NtrC family response regulator
MTRLTPLPRTGGEGDRNEKMEDTSLLEGKKILIVDDEPDVLDVLEELLSMCEVTRAADFEQAGRYLDSTRFDLVILDIMGVEGYKLLNIARQRNMTAVMLTAHAFSPDNLEKSIRKGAASYIPKEELSRITSFLLDVLKSQKQESDPWSPWQDRLTSSYFSKRWGAAWQDTNKEFWKTFWASKKKKNPEE